MNEAIATCAWSIDQLQVAIAALARQQGWECPSISASTVQALRQLIPEQQITHYSQLVGLSSRRVYAPLTETAVVLPALTPALLLSTEPEHTPRQLFVIVRCNRKQVYLLAPDLKTYPVLLADLEAGLSPVQAATPLNDLLDQLPVKRQLKARQLLFQQAAKQRLEVWHFQVASLPWYLQFKQQGGLRTLAHIFAAYIAQYGLLLLAWWVIGYSTLRGHFDSGWFGLWVLLLAALPILKMSLLSSQGALAIRFGVLIKQRLLSNALEQNPESVFAQGSGQIMGRIFESDRLHSLALNSGFITLFAVFEYAMAGVIISLGSGGALAIGLWGFWLVFSLYSAWILYQRRKRWTQVRLEQTQQLIDKMQGHRTRLIQESVSFRHSGEDTDLTDYLHLSEHMDQATVRLQAVIPRVGLLLGCIGLAPGLLALNEPRVLHLAIGLGGILLSFQALRRLVLGMTELISAVIAYGYISAYLSLKQKPPKAFPLNLSNASSKTGCLLKAVGLNYAYNKTREPILKHCNITINYGDRILLSGTSGSGKSTLAALLAGLKQPQSGLLTLKGLDLPTISHQGWRLSVAAAPQFHQNHVLANTFIFNLLMGREWPPRRKDVIEAEEICEALGLMPLLERMPAGLSQMVGETGWQLSHGERSRLYIARALLQGAELIILDESFAALDPENLKQTMMCVQRRASTLLVIAHP